MNTIAIIIYIPIILGCSVVCIVLGRYVAQGKGDSLISGYNTLPKEKQAEYDIVRLRRVVSLTTYAIAAILPLFCTSAFLPVNVAIPIVLLLTAIIIVIAIVSTTYGDKWAKKR